MDQKPSRPVSELITLQLSSTGQRLWKSRELFGASRRIEIDHSGEIYQLQITRQGKLILTK